MRQSASRVAPGFCIEFAGTAYGFTFRIFFVRLSAGEPESIELVFVSFQRISSSESALTSSNTAFELTKCWVPPSSVENDVPGDFPGQTVEPGSPGRTANAGSSVLKSTPSTAEAPATRSTFESA